MLLRPRDFKINLSEFNEFIMSIFLGLGLTLFLNAMSKALIKIQIIHQIDMAGFLNVIVARMKEHFNEACL